ncbi:polysaccharide deacetylase family protein [Cohnella abietis]|uniref:NodB homology domain-containing protein n=1 Tax=Cohnella abietis TaxID=2507935 RepID=A0A3T1DCK0_9BACL|nr:polysaccharide deacetylase family protein [Cohnella abietis]BBI35881.1 hypothetical protein KCTCHS21_52800 [Cohnella abietis]
MITNQVVSRIPTNRKIIALTFDIANGNKVPVRMLSLLKRKGVKSATFFVTGIWVRSYPRIARLIVQHGYEIASHGNRHQDYRKHSNIWIAKEVKVARKSINQATGIMTNMIRTPGGEMNARVIQKLQSMNQTIVHWDVDSLDWKLTDVKEIVDRVVPHARKGSNVLLHASDPWTQSLKAVPLIIKGLSQKGYRFVTVSDLLRGTKNYNKKAH